MLGGAGRKGKERMSFISLGDIFLVLLLMVTVLLAGFAGYRYGFDRGTRKQQILDRLESVVRRI
jgi:hypothetical protein